MTTELSSLLSRSPTLLSSIRSHWHLGCRGSFPRQLSWAMGRSSITQFADGLPLQAWPRLVDKCIRYAKCTRGQRVYKPWQCDTEQAAQRGWKNKNDNEKTECLHFRSLNTVSMHLLSLMVKVRDWIWGKELTFHLSSWGPRGGKWKQLTA